ncbi:MAG TPA: glycosyltransferase family 4 protein [Tepidisphaeraceae bacterium]|nr:glycosyltransferase family 4 protein [Tepidisphaeraceae bacterium]
MRKPRVLLIAEAANPEWVSVPLVGWSHARALARVVDAHLVTQVRNRAAMLRAGLAEGRDFTSIDSEAVTRKTQQLGKLLRGGQGKGWTVVTAMKALAFPYFERLVWGQFGDRLKAGEFDIVHLLTPLSPTSPSRLASKCRKIGIPFVWGPLNGGVPWPKGFDQARRDENEWLSYIRSAYKLLPGYSATRRNASAILIGSRATWEQMAAKYHPKCFYIVENAIDPQRFQRRRTRSADRPIRAIFIGRLVPYKGADMLLEAASPLLKSGAMTLEIVGDGPQLPQLRERAKALELPENAVRFSGWVEHGRIQDRLVDADLLTFPSIREFGGGVALEAMAVGVVPVVTDYGGLGELVTEQTGFLIPIGTREQIIGRLRDTLTTLAENPALIDARSEPAWRRAHEQFTWDAKARQVLRIYEWLLDKHLPKPQFPMPTPDSPAHPARQPHSVAAGVEF